MKKPVWLSIRSTQTLEGMEPERIDLVTEATYYRRGRNYFVVYDESEATGMNGSRTTLRVDEGSVALSRTGTWPSRMLFAAGQRNFGLYQTPYGAMTIGVHTSSMKNALSNEGGSLSIDYTIEIEHAVVSENHFELRISDTPLLQ